MKYYWVILNIGMNEADAKAFRVLMIKENHINPYKLFLRRDKTRHWRVVRKIFEWELNDPLLGNRKTITQYRQHLRNETRKAKRMIRGLK